MVVQEEPREGAGNVLEIELDAARRAELHRRTAAELDALLTHLQTARAWP
jgi:hypothetical protein